MYSWILSEIESSCMGQNQNHLMKSLKSSTSILEYLTEMR